MLGFADFFKSDQLSSQLGQLADGMISSHAPTLGGGKEV
jgi:hypothetical protein